MEYHGYNAKLDCSGSYPVTGFGYIPVILKPQIKSTSTSNGNRAELSDRLFSASNTESQNRSILPHVENKLYSIDPNKGKDPYSSSGNTSNQRTSYKGPLLHPFNSSYLQ